MNIFEKIDLIKMNLDQFTAEDKQNIVSVLDKYLNVKSNVILKQDVLMPFSKGRITNAKNHIRIKVRERFFETNIIDRFVKLKSRHDFYKSLIMLEKFDNSSYELQDYIYDIRLNKIENELNLYYNILNDCLDENPIPNWILNSYISINVNPEYKDINYKIKETQKSLIIDEYYNYAVYNNTLSLLKKISLLNK